MVEKMTCYGICMGVNGVIKGINMYEYRMLFPVNPDLGYDVLKDKIVNTVFVDKHFSKPLSLNSVLTDCLAKKVIPLVNITCEDWYEDFTSNVSLEDIAKIAGVIRDYLKERGFSKGNAYIGLFNEPGERTNMSSEDISDYTNAVHDEVGEDFDVVYGNDEFNKLDWNYLGQHCRAKVMGIHHLSSLGSWTDSYKYFSHIKDCKTIANTYGKEIIGTECGSWFKDYCKEGHQVNLDIMKECKKYDYLGCLLVLPQMNEYSKKTWKLLGYEIYNNDFTKKVSGCSDKFNEFLEFIKLNGTVPIFEEDDMKLERFYYRNRPVSLIKDDPKGYGIMFLRKCFGLFHSNVFDEALEAKVRQYQIDNELLVDGRIGPETFGNMILVEDFYKNYCWVHSLWARGFTY